MKKTIRFHADDYGWDTFANEGILECVEKGLLDGVSIMSTHSDEDDLIKIKKAASGISLGLHFTLSKGSPIEISNPKFLNQRGQLHSSYHLCYLVLNGKVKKEEIKTEFLFQLHRLYDVGIQPAYLDSHQHIHAFPFIHQLLPELIKGTSIKYVRQVNPFSLHDFRRVILKSMYLKNHLYDNSELGSEVLITETLSKQFKVENIEPLLLNLSRRSYKSIEFMWHPATQNRTDSFMNRTNDLNLLLNTPWNELFVKYKMERLNT
ncbi:MAG: ChbG/HpnK family deacetylase [Cytophagaceae bacterium]